MDLISILRLLNVRCHANQFWGKIGEIGRPHLIRRNGIPKHFRVTQRWSPESWVYEIRMYTAGVRVVFGLVWLRSLGGGTARASGLLARLYCVFSSYYCYYRYYFSKHCHFGPLIRSDIRPMESCHFRWPLGLSLIARIFTCDFRVVMQQLTRFQLTERVARSLCDSRASCFYRREAILAPVLAVVVCPSVRHAPSCL